MAKDVNAEISEYATARMRKFSGKKGRFPVLYGIMCSRSLERSLGLVRACSPT